MKDDKTLLEDLKKWAKSDKGKAHFENIRKKRSIRKGRLNKFTKWLEDGNDFDKLLYKLILKHGDDYVERCYNNGCEPHPNNVLTFIFDYVIENGDDVNIKELRCEFPSIILELKGYYFQVIWGQGAIQRIYNKEDMRMILQI